MEDKLPDPVVEKSPPPPPPVDEKMEIDEPTPTTSSSTSLPNNDETTTTTTTNKKDDEKKKAVQIKPRKRKIKKKPKDSSAPKFPLTGYVRYVNERREVARRENPTANAIDITKLIAEEWNKMPDENKKPFLQAAEIDKER